jgi:integrase
MLRPAFEQWRDVGLRGYSFEGLRRPQWRGFTEDRDVAFAEGLWGTGLRLREWASVLDVEVSSAGGERYPRAWLAAACVKGGRRGRWYRIPRRALGALGSYLDPVAGSRAEVVARARDAGRYDRLAGMRVVTGYDPRRRVLFVDGPSGPAPVPVDVLGPDERRLLFRRAPGGLEPLAVWLSVNGLPKKPHGWEDTFADANTRIARAWAFAAGHGPGGVPAAEECPLWCRPHMCRHSFALKWFSILSVVWEQRLEGFTIQEMRDLREQFGDIWYQLATMLGHSDPSVTRDYYLEPFTGLQADYLMALLDEEEQGGVEALVRAVAGDSVRVLTGPAAVSGGAGVTR